MHVVDMATFIYLSLPLGKESQRFKKQIKFRSENLRSKDANLCGRWVDSKCSQLPIGYPSLCFDQILLRLLSFLLVPELRSPPRLCKH